MFAGLVLMSAAPAARAAELIPSVVMTRPLDSNSSSTGGGLALRFPVGVFSVEGGAMYHESSLDAGQLHVRSWPVTASLWFSPVNFAYLGGGLGVYNTTFDYKSSAISDETKSQMSAHLGGGVRAPLTHSLGVDVQGRYNFLSPNEDKLTTQDLHAETWSSSIGLSLRF